MVMRLASLIALSAILMGFNACRCRNIPQSAKNKAKQNLRTGIVALMQNRLEVAENACAMAKQFNPCMAEAHNCLGLVAFRRGRLAKADKLFKEAVFISPDFAEARNNVGNVAFKRRDYRTAAHWFKTVLDRVPCHSSARYNRSLSLIQLHQWKLGRQNSIRHRICLQGAHKATVRADFLLGLIEFHRKSYKRSLSHFRDALRITPRFADAELMACKAQYQLKEFVKACAHCQRARGIRTKHSDTLRSLHAIRAKLKPTGQSCP